MLSCIFYIHGLNLRREPKVLHLRCMLASNVVGFVYILMQITFSVCHIIMGKRLISGNGSVLLDFYCDKVCLYIYTHTLLLLCVNYLSFFQQKNNDFRFSCYVFLILWWQWRFSLLLFLFPWKLIWRYWLIFLYLFTIIKMSQKNFLLFSSHKRLLIPFFCNSK